MADWPCGAGVGREMKEALIITGWGWKEYAVAAAAALRALKGEAEVVGLAWEFLCYTIAVFNLVGKTRKVKV